MVEIYNKEYFENYKLASKQVNYKDSSEVKALFHKIAKKIVDDLNPKTVLDVGCATGHLVAALRNLGVDAYGIDVSEYAISNVGDDIKPYCYVGSIADYIPKELLKKYDLVFCNQVLEYVYDEDLKKAIGNISSLSDTVLFGKSDSTLQDTLLLSVRHMECWSKIFAEFNMFNMLDYMADFDVFSITMYYKTDKFPRVVENYERHIRIIKKQKQDVQTDLEFKISKIEKEKKTLEDRLAQYAEVFSRLGKVKTEFKYLERKYKKLRAKVNELKAEKEVYESIANSTIWKMTKPIRALTTAFKKLLRKIKNLIKLFFKGIKSIFTIGPRATWSKFRNRSISTTDYIRYMKKNRPTEQELQMQRAATFDKKIIFSIIVPLYNTPTNLLKAMIDSVINQTYALWELCLADGSDSENSHVDDICKQYVEDDSRIVYKKLDENMGIPGNTNAALKMAQGDYIVLFDHDDILHPSALYECMKAITEKDADMIYTDEMVFEGEIENVKLIHFKPDFSPDTLLGHNYICHLCAYSVALQKQVGYFSDKHHGSQDYDMILRLTEKAKHIVHIPKVLYFWRSHPLSVASNVKVKPYCMDSAKKAIADHLERTGKKGKVVDSSILSTYKVEYEIDGNPKVSILIPNKDNIEYLEVCIDSILKRSTYENYEIIVIENNSEKEQTLDYYRALERRDARIRVIYYEGDFNYSAINNFGAKAATGEYLLLLNNDTEIITHNWIEEMLMYAQRDDVGAVGSLLYYKDNTVQHAGLIIGIGGSAGHAHRHVKRNSGGYIHRLSIAQNVSGVTAACLMTSRKVWNEMHGLDESFKVAFNDVDFCLRLREAGYLIIFTPYAELYHYESKSRGYEDKPEKQARFMRERKHLRERWCETIDCGDPYYNPNLTLDAEDFTLR